MDNKPLKKFVCSVCQVEIGPPNQGDAFFPKRGYGHLRSGIQVRDEKRNKLLFCPDCWRNGAEQLIRERKNQAYRNRSGVYRYSVLAVKKVWAIVFGLLFLIGAILMVLFVSHFGGTGI
jgi:hypothetical protein